ncbi:hypothetical protein [Streptomyces glaucescens]
MFTSRVLHAADYRSPAPFTGVLGRDLHWWLTRTGLDTAPLGRLLSRPQPGRSSTTAVVERP